MKGKLISMSLVLMAVLITASGCGPAGSMIITGTVTDFETGAPVGNLELSLYTYEAHQCPTVFPGKDKIASTTTDKQGEYQFEVMLEKHDKVVVKLESGQWRAVEVKKGVVEINLQKGAPMPCAEQEFVEVSQEESEEIARNYLLNSSTFKFDGIEGTLELIATNEVTCPYCWEFVFEFQCRHAGYGDRTGQMLAEVITPHTAEIIVEQGEVVSAIIDEQWDMMKQQMIEWDTGDFPYEPTEEIVGNS